jgi:hypothetical protein
VRYLLRSAWRTGFVTLISFLVGLIMARAPRARLRPSSQQARER